MSMTAKQHVDHWLKGSAESMKVMRGNIRLKNRTFAMFAGHLAIEKMLKAVCAVRRISIPTQGGKGHNLSYLALQCGLSLTPEQSKELETIRAFNIEGRYDDYKLRFHKLCTEQYVSTWSSVIEAWYKALKTQVEKERAFLPNNSPIIINPIT
jgi:HEPN domain-containing protein